MGCISALRPEYIPQQAPGCRGAIAYMQVSHNRLARCSMGRQLTFTVPGCPTQGQGVSSLRCLTPWSTAHSPKHTPE